MKLAKETVCFWHKDNFAFSALLFCYPVFLPFTLDFLLLFTDLSFNIGIALCFFFPLSLSEFSSCQVTFLTWTQTQVVRAVQLRAIVAVSLGCRHLGPS